MQELQNKISFSKKNHLLQLIIDPFKILVYLFWTRLAFLLNRPIGGKATLFFNKSLAGFFPEPVFSYIYLYGFSEEDLTLAVKNRLKKGMVFLDIGSHIGYYSVLVSTLVGSTGKVYAFEPTPSTFEILQKNTRDLHNVKIFPFAVWSKVGNLVFKDYGHFYSGCNSYTEARMPEKYLKKVTPKDIKVQAVSMDYFCKKNNIRPDFVKIDAESSEYDVLTGMREIIKKFKPMISMEIGDKEIDPKNGTKTCIEFLQRLGYTAYDLEDGGSKKHALKPNYYEMYNNLLLLPNKKI